MAKHKYVVASPEGASHVALEHPGTEVGDTVDLDLTHETETALVAAGWLAHEKKKEASK